MKKKNAFILLLCAVLAFGLIGLAGCAGDPAQTGNDVSDGGSAEPVEQTYRVALYFANEEYIAVGDESLEKFIVTENEMTSLQEDVYKNALELLRTPRDEGSSTMITGQIKFNDVYLEGDTVFVDVNGSGLNGGSLSESVLISQIVDTLINSFDEVRQVQFLVDGEIAETLMGHVGTAEPFTKDAFAE